MCRCEAAHYIDAPVALGRDQKPALTFVAMPMNRVGIAQRICMTFERFRHDADFRIEGSESDRGS